MNTDNVLEVTWYGQAMFTIKGGGITICCDPVSPETGYRYDPVSADLVLITHEHFDHNYLEGVSGSPKVVSDSGVFEYDGLSGTGIPDFHDSSQGSERGSIVMFSWEQAGFRLAHIGDLGEGLSADRLETLRNLDVLMIPVGGVYTIDGKQAAELAGELAPSIAIPMHYKTPDCVIPLEPVDEFVQWFAGDVKEISDRPVEITRVSIPSATEAWVVTYQ